MSSKSQEKRFVRVAEGIYRYKGGGFYARATVNGKASWQKLEAKDLIMARREARDTLQGLERVDRAASRLTLRYFADQVLSTSPETDSRSYKNKKRVIERIKNDWPGGSEIAIGKVKASDIRAFVILVTEDAGASYYNYVLGMVRNCFRAALEARAIVEIPGVNTRKEDSIWKPRKISRIQRLVPSVEQFRAIVASIRNQEFADTRDETADFVEAEGLLGLGQAELTNLRMKHVDLEKGTIQVLRIKTQAAFTVMIYPQARALIVRRMERAKYAPDAPLFSIKDAKAAVANACKRLKFPHFSQRSFRRMFVTEALRRGVNVKVIADFQGHRDGGRLILQTYSDVIGEKERAEAGAKIAAAFA